MKVVCCSFKKVEEIQKSIQDTKESLKKEGLSIKKIKVIDRIADPITNAILPGTLIIMAE